MERFFELSNLASKTAFAIGIITIRTFLLFFIRSQFLAFYSCEPSVVFVSSLNLHLHQFGAVIEPWICSSNGVLDFSETFFFFYWHVLVFLGGTGQFPLWLTSQKIRFGWALNHVNIDCPFILVDLTSSLRGSMTTSQWSTVNPLGPQANDLKQLKLDECATGLLTET